MATYASPAFLLHFLVRRTDGLRAGKYALLHAGEEHDWKFKSLCAVNRHHDGGRSAAVVVVDIGNQRDFFKKGFQGRVGCGVGIVYGVGDKFLDVRRAVFGFGLV